MHVFVGSGEGSDGGVAAVEQQQHHPAPPPPRRRQQRTEIQGHLIFPKRLIAVYS